MVSMRIHIPHKIDRDLIEYILSTMWKLETDSSAEENI